MFAGQGQPRGCALIDVLPPKDGYTFEPHRYTSLNQTRSSSNGTVDSCRKEALGTLFGMAIKGKIVDSNRLQEAWQCWKQALGFYLSYPVDLTYGSHVIPFLASLWVTDGAILELGSGWYSTPVAHRISDVHNRSVLTADSTYTWLNHFLFLSSSKHSLYLVGDTNQKVATANGKPALEVVRSWKSIGHQQKHWGFIFVDHAPSGQRVVDLERLRQQGDLFLIHDTESANEIFYKVANVLGTFKYRTTFGPGWSVITTDAVSDTRPELVQAVEILCKWSIELIKHTNEH
jgi:hypothetical protein